MKRTWALHGTVWRGTTLVTDEELARLKIEQDAPDVINIRYPSGFESGYLRPEIRLEIGPMAQWIPNARYEVRSYAAEVLPKLFDQPGCRVHAIKAERTFWEKATILHHEANRPETSPVPARYSRHYYDLFKMAEQTALKNAALAEIIPKPRRRAGHH